MSRIRIWSINYKTHKTIDEKSHKVCSLYVRLPSNTSIKDTGPEGEQTIRKKYTNRQVSPLWRGYSRGLSPSASGSCLHHWGCLGMACLEEECPDGPSTWVQTCPPVRSHHLGEQKEIINWLLREKCRHFRREIEISWRKWHFINIYWYSGHSLITQVDIVKVVNHNHLFIFISKFLWYFGFKRTFDITMPVAGHLDTAGAECSHSPSGQKPPYTSRCQVQHLKTPQKDHGTWQIEVKYNTNWLIYTLLAGTCIFLKPGWMSSS